MEILSSLLTDVSFDWEGFLKIAGIFVAAALVLGFVGRGVFGKRSNLNLAVSSAVGILFIYIVTVIVVTFGSELAQFEPFLSPLPFVDIQNGHLHIFSLVNSEYPQICAQILSMIILAFLVNLLDGLLPRGENVFTWFIFRCMTVVLSILMHLVVTTAFESLLPEIIASNAPVILLWLLVIMLAVGALKFFVGAALATVNPIIGVLYTFFFANVVGKQLSKAVLTTTILTALVRIINELGIHSVVLNTGALSAYMPFLGILVLIWYALNHLL